MISNWNICHFNFSLFFLTNDISTRCWMEDDGVRGEEEEEEEEGKQQNNVYSQSSLSVAITNFSARHYAYWQSPGV